MTENKLKCRVCRKEHNTYLVLKEISENYARNIFYGLLLIFATIYYFIKYRGRKKSAIEKDIFRLAVCEGILLGICAGIFLRGLFNSDTIFIKTGFVGCLAIPLIFWEVFLYKIKKIENFEGKWLKNFGF